MKIIELKAENIKKLVAVEIKPDGNMVQITGKNGQGKTSVLDSIWWALAGASNIQASPIRQGEKSARIRLDMGELIVTRTFRQPKEGGLGTSSIIVENADGARFPSPQRMLDDLIGSLSFDPLGFARMEGKKKYEVLKQFVSGANFEEIDEANKTDYEERTWKTRKMRELRAAGNAIVVDLNLVSMYKEKIDEYALVKKMQEANAHNLNIQSERMRRTRLVQDQEDIVRSAADKEKQIKQLQLEIEELRKKHAGITKEMNSLKDVAAPIDLTDITKEAEIAKRVNAELGKKEERDKYFSDADFYENEALKLTDKIKAREEEKIEKIKNSKMPIDGVSFKDGEVMINGMPFNQLSDAEQLRISVSIAMALNPKIKIIRIRDGSLLDENSLKIVGEMADQKDFQVWIEMVRSDAKMGFILEDGMIKNATQETEQAKKS